MIKPVPDNLINDFNLEVLSLLKGQSCHGDIIGPIESCIKKYKDVDYFCPDGANYSYSCWYINNIIFAYAINMSKVSLRLAQSGELKLSTLDVIKKNHSGSWYSVPYDSKHLNNLVESAYKFAKNT